MNRKLCSPNEYCSLTLYNQNLSLQVSSKGMKMVQTPDKSSSSMAASKKRMLSASSESLKQFVPHSSITCVTQGDAPNDDVVSCIVLLSSPDSDCPLFVHSYRDVTICSHLRCYTMCANESVERFCCNVSAKFLLFVLFFAWQLLYRPANQ